jgi:hypothetical protein
MNRNCQKCNTPTKNPKFCSKSCAAIYNNSKFPKRSPESLCIECKIPCSKSRTHCRDCWQKINHRNHQIRQGNITLGEFQGKRKYQKNSQIRTFAQRLIRFHQIPQICMICSYDKHVEIHHIQPVSSFSSDSLLSEINSLQNLIILCPNCHWEADNNLIPVVGIEPTMSVHCPV